MTSIYGPMHSTYLTVYYAQVFYPGNQTRSFMYIRSVLHSSLALTQDLPAHIHAYTVT